jgi:hypothetical protein
METRTAGSAQIEVVRESRALRDTLFRYIVWIDNAAAGRISNGETKRYSVGSGHHTVRVGLAAWLLGDGRVFTSATRGVEARGGETVTLTCRPTAVHEVWDLFRPHRRLHLGQPVRAAGGSRDYDALAQAMGQERRHASVRKNEIR